MIIRRLKYSRLLCAILMMVGMSVVSCINDYDICPDDSHGEANVSLQFTLTTGKSSTSGRLGSRADFCDDYREGELAENVINVSDIQFYLFDADQKVVCTFHPEVKADNDVLSRYLMTCQLNVPYFDEIIRDGNDDTPVTFYIMVIANAQSLSGQYMGYYPGVTTIKDICDQLNTFTLAPRKDNYGVFSTWQPSVANGPYIPMAGIQQFTVTAKQLKESTGDSPLNLSPTGTGDDGGRLKYINMLRAMAKLEIVDHIYFAANELYDATKKRPKIDKAELIGFFTKGTLLPAYSQLNTTSHATEDVTEATLPASTYYTAPTAFSTSYATNDCLMFFDDQVVSQKLGGFPVKSAYIPEFEWNEDLGGVRPYFALTLQDDLIQSEPKSPVVEMQLSKYTGGNASEAIDELLRNHIYRFQVDNINSKLQLTLNVLPWESQEIIWDFTDNPGVAQNGHLMLQTEEPEFNRNSATYYYTSQIIGEFKYSSPVGAKWYATLVPANDHTAPEDFVFVGSGTNTIYGEISSSNEKDSFVIRATKSAAGYDRAVNLIFYIETPEPDSRTISGNDIYDDTYLGTSGKPYITIVQQRNS